MDNIGFCSGILQLFFIMEKLFIELV